MKKLGSSVMIMALIFGATVASAATWSVSLTPPTTDGSDQANWSTASIATDKFWAENSGAGKPKGQSFTTTNDVVLRSITYQVADTQKAEPTKVYRVRLGIVDGNTFHEIHVEEATQSSFWTNSAYATWTFDTPQVLYSNVVYGVDVCMKSSTSGWQSGIPYLQYNNTETFAGGTKYGTPLDGVGFGTSTIEWHNGRDRRFHIDMEATNIVDVTSPTLTNIVDNVGGGPINEDRVVVTYTLYFDESVDTTTIDLADFENLGSGVTLVSVDSVADTAVYPLPSVVEVAMRVSGTGTLNLGVRSDATISDASSNPLTVPVTDDTTITVNAGTTPVAGVLYWDGTITSGITDGASQGGNGTWDLTTTCWDFGAGFSGPFAWPNTTNDTAVFGGSAGEVTLDVNPVLGAMGIEGSHNFYIGSSDETNSLVFGGANEITVTDVDAYIRCGITGSPTINARGRNDSNNGFLALEPTADVTMTVGTLNKIKSIGSQRNATVYLGGQSQSNVVDIITWTTGNQQCFIRKRDTTNGGPDGSSWTINQNVELDVINGNGRVYVEEGTLICGGTNNQISHSFEVQSGGRAVVQGNWRIHDENEDFRVLSGGIVAPGPGIATATFNWNSSRGDPSVGLVDLRTGSTYEWEVGPGGTDVIALTEPVANGNAELVVASGTTLKAIEAGGTPPAGTTLTVFTYDAGVVTPDTATLNANMTIDISDTSFSGTPSLVNDGNGTIYVEGISSGAGGTMIILK